MPSYDRTEALLNTFAWWSDDDGATADSLRCGRGARLVDCRRGSAIDDDSSVIGFVHGRRHSYELRAPSVASLMKSAGVLKFRECLQSVLGPARQNHLFVDNL